MNSKLSNVVQLIGHVGNKPELKEFGEGFKVAQFSLATSESYKNKQGEWVNVTQWHTCKAFNKTAEYIAKSVDKGNEILCSGKIQYSSWTDKENVKRYTTEILVNEVLIINKK